jgi:signal transduction histidine kinase
LDERARIARELHDVLAHSLGALAVQLDVAQALLVDGGDLERVQDRLQRARGLAVDGLSEARRAVAALRGDIPSLPQLLDGLLQQFRSEGGVAAPLEICGTERFLAADAALAALRTAQEALTNARKHAPGATIRVALTYTEAATVLSISDTPAPIPVGSRTTDLSATGAGYGLPGLRERAEAIGGTLHAGPDGDGWTIRLSLPASANDAA